MPTVLIVGATSALAHETARRFAADGASFLLAGRHADRLHAVADDLRTRGAAEARSVVFDAADFDGHAALVDAARQAFPAGLDYALVAYGTLPDQAVVAEDAEAATEAFTLNATSVIALLTRLGSLMEAQGRGGLAVISSVAGDRGRPSNYLYGAAKGAVSLFTGGLRARLAKKGVQVTTIKPGMVDTPMTAHLDKGPLFADPAAVGARIHRAMTAGRDVVYVPGFWRGIMAVIRAIPERVFKKLDL